MYLCRKANIYVSYVNKNVSCSPQNLSQTVFYGVMVTMQKVHSDSVKSRAIERWLWLSLESLVLSLPIPV